MKVMLINLVRGIKQGRKANKRLKFLKKRLKFVTNYCMKHADEDCTASLERIGRLTHEINMLKLGKVQL